ncbi:MAG TPA: hypothetical protein VI316_11025 [Candidatus Dormibacteraeota bacterium]
MRRHKSELADASAVPAAIAEAPAEMIEATGAALEALAVDVADRTSSVIADITESVNGKRKRHPVRWLTLFVAAGGAAYVVVRTGAHNRVRSLVRHGHDQPPGDDGSSTPEPTSPPSISVTGAPDAEPNGSATDGAAGPEPAARDAGLGGKAG